MLKKLLLSLLPLFSSTAYCQAFVTSPQPVTLERNNTVVIRGEINSTSMGDATTQYYKLNKTLPSDQPIYVYLDTPGGSVTDGLAFINYVKSTGREVKTITSTAASMGFITAQALGERLVLRDGVYMMHQASSQVGGQVPGQLAHRTQFTLDYINVVEEMMAERLKMSMEDYRALVHDEYYVVGAKAVETGVADRLVAVTCGKSLQGSHKKTLQLFIFTFKVEMADCPLVATPLTAGATDANAVAKNPELYQEALEQINNEFYTNYKDSTDIRFK